MKTKPKNVRGPGTSTTATHPDTSQADAARESSQRFTTRSEPYAYLTSPRLRPFAAFRRQVTSLPQASVVYTTVWYFIVYRPPA